jgi:hypothetical protein
VGLVTKGLVDWVESQVGLEEGQGEGVASVEGGKC